MRKITVSAPTNQPSGSHPRETKYYHAKTLLNRSGFQIRPRRRHPRFLEKLRILIDNLTKRGLFDKMPIPLRPAISRLQTKGFFLRNYSRHNPDKPHYHAMTTLLHENYTGPRYTYGLRNRPLSMGTAPKGYIIGSDGPPAGRARWGTIQYPRQLTADEIYDYELEIVLDTLPTNPTLTAP